MPANITAQSKMSVVALTLLLIAASGLVAGTAPVQRSELSFNGTQAGQTFFIQLETMGSGSYAGATPTGLPLPPQTFPIPQVQSADDFTYVLQNGAYGFFPSSSNEEAQSSAFLIAQVPQLWSDSQRKRSRFRTYVEILELLVRGPLSPFEVAFRLRLNSKRTKEYLEFLEQKALVEYVEEGRILYRITPAGMALVERVRTVLFLDN